MLEISFPTPGLSFDLVFGILNIWKIYVGVTPFMVTRTIWINVLNTNTIISRDLQGMGSPVQEIPNSGDIQVLHIK